MYANEVQRLLNESVPEKGTLLKTMILFTKIRPLARPRVNRRTGHAYQPKDNQLLLFEQILSYTEDHTPIKETVIVDTCAVFDRGKTKAEHPIALHYGDEDNIRKALCDSLQPRILEDDKWIIGGKNYKIFGSEDCALVQIFSIKRHSSLDPIRSQL